MQSFLATCGFRITAKIYIVPILCMCERKRERKCMCVKERERVCVRKREIESVCLSRDVLAWSLRTNLSQTVQVHISRGEDP